MAKSLRSTFDSKVFGNTLRLDGTRGEGSIPRWKLHKLAREMNMTVESVIVAKEIFDDHDFDGSGMLSLDEIAKVIETLMEFQIADKECVNYRIESGQTNRLLNYWLKFAPEGVFELDFESFLIWYSCTGFLTELMIDDREIRLRLLAKANNLDALCMDRVRKSFNSIDVDGSGEVDIREFESILREATAPAIVVLLSTYAKARNSEICQQQGLSYSKLSASRSTGLFEAQDQNTRGLP